jgi:Fur family transcriptional regulator, peroxide stress response regulator
LTIGRPVTIFVTIPKKGLFTGAGQVMAERTRQSRQRNHILEVLHGTRTHPTARWLYDRVRKQFPSLSLGTVYRNLGILEKQGLVKKLDFGDGSDRFEAATIQHHHFICESCGRVIDLDLPVDDSLTRKLEKATGYTATRHEIRLFGLCDKCGPTRPGNKRGEIDVK